MPLPASDARKGIGCAETWVCVVGEGLAPPVIPYLRPSEPSSVGDGVLDVPAWDARKG